jgi:hypothetical protein
MRIAMLALALSLAACGGKKDKDKDTGSATAQGSDTKGSGSDTTMAGSGSGSGTTMAGSGSADAGSGSADAGSGSAVAAEVKMPKGAGKCPSTVLGATSKAEVKGKDVVLTITATDKDAIASIQKRSEEVIKEKTDGGATSGTAHDQKGTHGGGVGLCPVYWTEGGKATQKKTDKGSTITITPKEKPEELKSLIDERIKKAEQWVKDNIPDAPQGNKGAVGGGKGDHGSTHSGDGDGKGKERKGDGKGDGKGTGGGTGKGDGKGGGKADKKNVAPADKKAGGW